MKESLIKRYGEDFANNITDAEAFEICEYGKQSNESEIRELFPMIEKTTKPHKESEHVISV